MTGVQTCALPIYADALKRNEFATVLATLLAIVACLMGTIVVVMSIVGPLQGLSKAMELIAGGAMAAPLPDHSGRDEVAAMARAAAVFRDAMVVREQLGAAAAVDASVRLERAAEVAFAVTEFDDAMAHALGQFRMVGDELSMSFSQLNSLAGVAAEKTSASLLSTGSITERISAMSKSTDEMSIAVAQVSHGMTRSAKVASDAFMQVEEAQCRMAELDKQARLIGAVVGLVADIAEQTNLLALNATIEAARAGDAGRGFAVVALEVKALATQTQVAARQITEGIAAIQDGANGVSCAINGMGDGVTTMRDIATALAGTVYQQDVTVMELAATMAMISSDAEDNRSSAAAAAFAVDSAEQVAVQVRETAQTLAESTTRLSTGVSRFLEKVRAA